MPGQSSARSSAVSLSSISSTSSILLPRLSSSDKTAAYLPFVYDDSFRLAASLFFTLVIIAVRVPLFLALLISSCPSKKLRIRSFTTVLVMSLLPPETIVSRSVPSDPNVVQLAATPCKSPIRVSR